MGGSTSLAILVHPLRTRMKRTKPQSAALGLYGIFVVGVGLVSFFNVLGYVRLDLSDSPPFVSGQLRPEDKAYRRIESLSISGNGQPQKSSSTTFGSVPASGKPGVNVTSTGMKLPQARTNGLVDGWGLYRLLLSTGSNDLKGKSHEHEAKATLSPPEGIFLDYMRHHSAEAMREESPKQFQKRKFAIAYYSCPHQLGNRFFHFMNNVLWAIVTNRTVLYKYLDAATCRQLKEAQPSLYLDDAICNAANRVEDCDAILERAPWLPSFEEFGDPSWDIHRVDFWQTHWFRMSVQWVRSRYPFDELLHAKMTKVDMIESKLVEFPALTNAETANLPSRFTRQELLVTSDARITARKLAHLGLRFVYGMLFAELFRLREEEADSIKIYYPVQENSTNFFSIALHSRHKHVKQNGRNIQNEKDCLTKVLVNRPEHLSCQVCAMSDRPLALTNLQLWLEKEHGCKLIRVQHSNSTTSFSVEHGPHAGAGFAQELDVCHRYGTHAVVTTSTGPGASSSILLEALVDYKINKKYGQGVITSATHSDVQYCHAYST